nr:proteoglycan 4-like [Arachis hypogaea]
MSVLISKQTFLPYGDYDGPPQKKRKTNEPTSSSAEPSAPPAPFVPTPRLQTPYELGREILQTLHRIKRRNARRFQWIVVKFDGHDPGPPPPDTPEPEPEESAAKASQADDPIEQAGASAIVEEPADHMIEEPVAVAEPIVETTSEPAGHTSEEPRPEPASRQSTDIIVYQRHHHPPPLGGGAS